jgi:hypothetical protein
MGAATAQTVICAAINSVAVGLVLIPELSSTRSRTRCSISGAWTDLSLTPLATEGFMLQSLKVGDQWWQSFMVWITSVWERFVIEALSPPTIAICTAIHKMHVRQFVKRMPIHIVIFKITQYKEIRISHYVL